ncbi:MAG: hypothetical protein AAF633_15845 [Chloroflexota bacterium]
MTKRKSQRIAVDLGAVDVDKVPIDVPKFPTIDDPVVDPAEILTTKDAVMLAYSNPAFAKTLIETPEVFGDAFNLEPEAMAVLKTMDFDSIIRFGPLVEDPINFSKSVEIVTNLAAKGGPYN